MIHRLYPFTPAKICVPPKGRLAIDDAKACQARPETFITKAAREPLERRSEFPNLFEPSGIGVLSQSGINSDKRVRLEGAKPELGPMIAGWVG